MHLPACKRGGRHDCVGHEKDLLIAVAHQHDGRSLGTIGAPEKSGKDKIRRIYFLQALRDLGMREHPLRGGREPDKTYIEDRNCSGGLERRKFRVNQRRAIRRGTMLVIVNRNFEREHIVEDLILLPDATDRRTPGLR